MQDAALDPIGAVALFSADRDTTPTDAVAFVALVVALTMLRANAFVRVEERAAVGALACLGGATAAAPRGYQERE